MIVTYAYFDVMSSYKKLNYLIEKEVGNERIILIGFKKTNLEGVKDEILEWVGVSRPNESKLYHFKISWSQYEIPLMNEVGEIVNSLLSKLQLDKEKIIYAVHHDTDNLHVHVLVYLSTKCKKIKFNNDVLSVGNQIASEFGFWCREHKHSRPKVRLPKELRIFLNENNPEEIVKIIKRQEDDCLFLEWGQLRYHYDELPVLVKKKIDGFSSARLNCVDACTPADFDIPGLDDLLNNDLDFMVELYEGENPRPISFDLTSQIMDLQRRMTQNQAANVKTKFRVYFKNKNYYFVSGAGMRYVDLTEVPVKFCRRKQGFKFIRFMDVDLYQLLPKVRSMNTVNVNDVLFIDPTLMGGKSRYAWWDAVLSSERGKIHDSRKLIVLKALDSIFNLPSDVNFGRWGAYAKYLDRAVENVVNKYGDDQLENIENLIPNLFPELDDLICKNLLDAFLRDDPMQGQQPSNLVRDAQAFPRRSPG